MGSSTQQNYSAEGHLSSLTTASSRDYTALMPLAARTPYMYCWQYKVTARGVHGPVGDSWNMGSAVYFEKMNPYDIANGQKCQSGGGGQRAHTCISKK